MGCEFAPRRGRDRRSRRIWRQTQKNFRRMLLKSRGAWRREGLQRRPEWSVF
ncbi:hypothetical protein F441_03464 [Phytophthora nicotianae CJ01A1]|uniref:Uncharacterized protein n=1 Tax=Phytophthora nicotianae CJ01A1 TaxID=1317063 RepID=W2XLX0_PHYNI|nr:hypothetical protein F441_03464 [Phytophthora nicotianae CJ01A1]